MNKLGDNLAGRWVFRNIGGLLAAMLCCLSIQLASQEFRSSGTVLDNETGRPLAFVNIVANDLNIGTSSDIDGKFSISSDVAITSLRLSYVGYEPKIVAVPGQASNLVIRMQRSSVELQEIVILAGENPAHRIIRNVIENRDKNDPEKLQSFAYTSYDKMIFTVDTLDIPEEIVAPGDSSDIKLREFIKDKDFFLMETVSERKFLAPGRNHEKVLATRISGFKDPVFLFLSSQLQSTSFYKEMIRISDKNYINPISKGSFRKYSFSIEDTTYTASRDTVFIISFRQRENTNFDGLNGVLSINSNGWAIQNVVAEPASNSQGVSVKIQQMYELINGEQWFPVQLNTDIIFSNVRVNSYAPVGRGKSYIRDIVLNPELVKRQFNQVSIEFDPRAGDRDDDFWMSYRGDSLSARDRNTYYYIDSVGKEANLDRRVGTIKALINNRLPISFVDIDLSKLFRYNRFEGVYLGLGLLTNQKFSQIIELGGFWGYGFGDKKAKFGGDVSFNLDRYRDVKLKLGYYDFATETGGVGFSDDRESTLNPASFRNFFINRMDNTIRMKASLSFRALRYATFTIGLTHDQKIPANNYIFGPHDSGQGEIGSTNDFRFTMINAGFRLAVNEKFLQMPDTKISLGTKWPVIRVNYIRGVNDFLEGAYSFNKVDVRVESKKYFKYVGRSELILRGGFVDRPIPYTDLYNGRGAYREISLYAPEAFVTMPADEFLADRYLFAFYTHNFGKLLLSTGKFSPEIAVAANFGIGDLDEPELHQNIDFKVMNQVYCESGLILNNLLKLPGLYSVGAGVFYRFGYFHHPELNQNFTYRLVLSLNF